MLFCLHTGCMTNKDNINKPIPSLVCRCTHSACVQVKPGMAPTQDGRCRATVSRTEQISKVISTARRATGATMMHWA